MTARTIAVFVALLLCSVFAHAQEFTLTTSTANIVSSRASIDMPGLTGNPWAVIVATPVGDTEAYNPNPIGVWYYANKWNIYNTNHTVMAPGLKYRIQFFTKPGPNQFVHIMTQQNIGAEGSYIDHQALNNNPRAQFRILQVHAPDVRPYNPNRFKAKAEYSSAAGRWYIANINGEPLGRDCAYNIVIGTGETVGTNPTQPQNPNPGTNPDPGPKSPNPKAAAGNTGTNPGTPPKSQEPSPTAAEIKEKLDKANQKLNDISKGATNLGGGPPTNPVGGTVAVGNVSGTLRMTGFNVKAHGLRFGNSFENPVFGPPINFTTKGLCGGNSYTVLDYFLAGVEIPKQDYRPAHSSPLHAYLSQRQFTSLLENVDKWLNYHNNPGGLRNLEIFNWGLREQLAVLRSYIDRGMPVPLGLKWTGGDISGKDHQVVAIGYDMGGYKGDVGDNKKDLKIYLYDPNYSGLVKTLVADPDKLEFYYAENTDVRWKSYFVDEKYRAMSPPAIPNPVEFQEQVNDGLIHALRLEFETGSVGLSRNLHVDLKVMFTDGTEQNYQNISQDGEWLRNYTEIVEVVLTSPRQLNAIRSLVINTNSGQTGGIVVWELDRIHIKAIGGGFGNYIAMKDPPSPPNTFKFIGIPLFLFPK